MKRGLVKPSILFVIAPLLALLVSSGWFQPARAEVAEAGSVVSTTDGYSASIQAQSQAWPWQVIRSESPVLPDPIKREYQSSALPALPLTFTVYLPVILDNAYGGWSTGIGIRNTSGTTATVQVFYYNANGSLAAIDSNSIAARGYWGAYQGGRLGPNWAGSATVRSDAAVAVAVNEAGPGNLAMGYSGVITPSSTLYLPVVMNNAYGGWTTGVGVMNSASVAAAVTISYYNSLGNLQGSEAATIPGNGYWGTYQGDHLTPGFAGSAVVTSDRPLAAVVNEIQVNGSAISYQGLSAGSENVYLPMVLNNAYGGWTTGIGMQNTSASQASGTITYYDSGGTPKGTETVNLPARGYLGLYQGSSGLDDGFAGSAVLRMNRPVVAVVNETKGTGDAMGYGGVTAGGSPISLPVVMDDSYGGWNTGISIQNASASAVNVTVSYFDSNGTGIGSSNQTIPAWGSRGIYQGGALGKQAGSARILSSGPIAAIVNEVGSNGEAISYNGFAGLPDDSEPPSGPARLIFIHHSTGENWLADDNGGLGLALRDHNYFVSDTNYGWGPDSIGDTTDFGHWWNWFRGPRSSTYLSALFAESEQHASYSRLASSPGGENEIIMFKSCFPNSALQGDPNDPVPPIGDNPLKGQGADSPDHTVANAKGIYIDLLEYFRTRQDKLFIVISAPPLSDPTYSSNARAFNQWLVNDWLRNYPYKNVWVFDFYNVLTTNGGDPNTNDLNRETGNHHRWWNGAIQHKTDGDDDGNPNVLEYPSGDDHPSQAGNRKATGEFVPLLDYVYHQWKS